MTDTASTVRLTLRQTAILEQAGAAVDGVLLSDNVSRSTPNSLVRLGLLDYSGRYDFVITEKGRAFLADRADHVS
jgi:hypothetical protein